MKEVPPFPDGNNSLPPRTNLIGFPSAFQDSISATGGPPVITTDPEVGGSPVPKSVMVWDWVKRNSTPILMVGLSLFVVLSVSR